jgi:hypothetical protein
VRRITIDRVTRTADARKQGQPNAYLEGNLLSRVPVKSFVYIAECTFPNLVLNYVTSIFFVYKF